jgi:phosphoglycerol transferase MdoB-like AlkP superfamily enzyme
MLLFRRWVPSHLRFILSVHLILMATFSLFRYVMLVYNKPAYFFDMERSISLRKAFQIGLWFDVTIASYAMILPYLALTYAYIRKKDLQHIYKYVRWYSATVILLSLVICAADVPYFKYYNSRLNIATVHLKNMAQIGEFIFKEVKYYPFILIFVLGLWGIRKLVRRVWNNAWKTEEHTSSGMQKWTATAIASSMLVYGLFGGPLPKMPDMKSATFSNDGFINQLTLNPVHTWFDSYFEFDINVLSAADAQKTVQQALGISYNTDTLESPVIRRHDYPGAPRKMNVVVILMESMSADRMGIFGSPDKLTPGLDRIAKNSMFFDQCYSSGIHTNCGIYSTLYGMPVMMMQHPMLNGVSEQTGFTGLPVTLKKEGYRTRFFCTHPKTFDNLDIFLEKNGFDQICDQKDYPPADVANAWGVGDEALMNMALHQLDSMDNSDKEHPFLATLLTISTHPPYTLSANTRFKPKSTDPILATYEYADWAISSFMDSCATKSWYKNTVFVLLGDHGVNLTHYVNDVPLSYNHIPLIVHAPGIFQKPEAMHGIASQTDVFPTVMGLLNLDYTQNTMGYDLFREKRPMAFFSQDHRLCAIDDRYLYVARKSGRESLYEYHSDLGNDLIERYPDIAETMKFFSCGHLKTARRMIEKEQTR